MKLCTSFNSYGIFPHLVYKLQNKLSLRNMEAEYITLYQSMSESDGVREVIKY